MDVIIRKIRDRFIENKAQVSTKILKFLGLFILVGKPSVYEKRVS